jgi:ribonuclease HI
VANIDLWLELCDTITARGLWVSWEWVRGHLAVRRGGDKWNHEADALAALATAAMRLHLAERLEVVR